MPPLLPPLNPLNPLNPVPHITPPGIIGGPLREYGVHGDRDTSLSLTSAALGTWQVDLGRTKQLGPSE